MSDLYVDRLNFRDGTIMGTPIQSVYTRSAALQTMTTTIPHDNTIPTSSEGTEVTALATTITPKKIGNVLKVSVNVMYACSTNINIATCLFKDSDAAAIAVVDHACFAAGIATVHLTHYEEVTSLTAITFKVRLGGASAGTISVNGLSGTQIFGGVACSTVTIEEIQA